VAEQCVVAAEHRVAAEAEELVVAGVANQDFVAFLLMKFRNGEKSYAANDAELQQISLGQSS
jgi:hypothetical protein